MAQALNIQVADQDHAVAIWGTTLIQVWRGAPTGAHSTEINQIARKLVTSSATKATSLFVVEGASPPPEEAARKTLAEFSKDIVSQMALAVVVAEGGGFRAALVRGVGLGLTRLLPHRTLFQFVNSVETGAELLVPHLPKGSGGEAGLLAAVEELRAKIG